MKLLASPALRPVWKMLLIGLVAPAVSHASTLFTDPTKVNVLREYNMDGTRAGTRSAPVYVNVSSSQASGSTTDGGGGKIQANGFTSSSTISETFTLSTARTVGGWSLQNRYSTWGNPTSMVLSGLVAGSWVVLDSFNPTATSINNRTFTPQTVTALKYVAGGANLNPVITQGIIGEMQVNLAATASQSLVGDRSTPAYNYLRDQVISTATSTTKSIAPGWMAPDGATITGWMTPSAGNASAAIDGNDVDSFLRASGGTASQYAYVRYDLGQTLPFTLANLGLYDSQTLAKFAFYGSALTTPNPDNPADWVKLYSQTSASSGGGQLINFGNNAGRYQHLLFIWQATQASSNVTELELYGFIPEPSTALLLLTGGGLLWHRRRRR